MAWKLFPTSCTVQTLVIVVTHQLCNTSIQSPLEYVLKHIHSVKMRFLKCKWTNSHLYFCHIGQQLMCCDNISFSCLGAIFYKEGWYVFFLHISLSSVSLLTSWYLFFCVHCSRPSSIHVLPGLPLANFPANFSSIIWTTGISQYDIKAVYRWVKHVYT